VATRWRRFLCDFLAFVFKLFRMIAATLLIARRVLFFLIVAASIKTPCLAGELDRARLVAAARAGGDYLVRMQKPDGSFHYIYDAHDDSILTDTYNILRHSGAALSLLDLYATTRDNTYLDSAARAITFLKTRFRPALKSDLYVLDFDEKAKLGASGLALIVLARQFELDPKRGDRPNAERLANLILSLQHKDGSFESYYRLHGHKPQGSTSLYYPGEAMLGLVQLFKLNGDRRLIDAVRRGADHLILTQRKMDEPPPDAWLMQALDMLHRINPERRYAEHTIDIAQSMIADQYTTDEKPGFQGGFGPGRPRATPAASRAEGIVAAYRLARRVGDARADGIGAALRLVAPFLLSQQIEPNDSSLRKPAQAQGGFRESATSWEVRIDYVQHNICALMGIAEALF